MTRPILITIIVFLFVTHLLSIDVVGQSINDSSATKDSVISNLNTGNVASEPDEEFNLFLFALATAFISIMIGGAIIGAFAATLVLLSLFGLVSLGILSVSLVTGLYDRSFKTGFKTFLIIACGLGGTIFGTAACWLVVTFFELKLSGATTLIGGATSGALGGIILGMIIYKLIMLSIKYFKPTTLNR